MAEIHFFVEQSPQGFFLARSVGQDIFTEADSLPELRQRLRDALHCHFEPGPVPSLIRLHITREVIFKL